MEVIPMALPVEASVPILTSSGGSRRRMGDLRIGDHNGASPQGEEQPTDSTTHPPLKRRLALRRDRMGAGWRCARDPRPIACVCAADRGEGAGEDLMGSADSWR